MTFSHETGATFQVDGAAMYWEERGDSDGEPLLLLHGGLGSIEDFNALLAVGFGAERRLIGVDSRGHGRSTLGTEPLSYERLERDVIALLKHLGIGQVDVLGFSDGGVVGYRLALSDALEVPKLATIGANYELREDDPIAAILEGVTAERWLRRFPGADERYGRINPEPDFERFVSSVVEMWTDRGPSSYPGAAIERLTSELLVIRGDLDHLFSRADAVRFVDRISTASLANIPFAGHATHEDQPRLVAEILTEFYRKPSRASS